MTYKVGDKIKVLVDYYSGCMPNGRGPKIGDILTVVGERECTTPGNWIDDRTAEVKEVNSYGNTEFALVEVKTKRFAVGDRVISIIDTPNIPEGFIGHIFSADKGPNWDYMVQGIKDQAVEYFNEDELELLSVGKRETKFNPTLSEIENYNFPDTITPQDIAGVYKSALDKQVGGGHYKEKGIQPIEYIFANNLGFCEANIVKYATRWKDKNGIQDLEKIIHYTELLIELTKKEESKDKEGK